ALKSVTCLKIGIWRLGRYDKTIVDGRRDNGLQCAAKLAQTIVQRRSRNGGRTTRIGVSETRVVPSDSKCQELVDVSTIIINCGASAWCCVIDFLHRPRESTLKCIGIFAEIVK